MLPVQPLALLRLPVAVAPLAVLAALFLFPGQVQAQNAPTLTGDDTASIAENTATSTVIKTYTATDADMDTLSWTLEGDDSGDFTIAGGELKFRAIPDYEAPVDADTDNDYEVTVKVTDDETSPMSATKEVTVTVTNADEPGTVTLSGMEKGGQTLTAALTDPDGTASNETWQWTRSATATGTFANISGATSSTYTLVAADVTNFVKVTASYTDPEGSGKSATSVATGEIAANNNEPEFSSMTATRSVNENTAANMNIGSAVTAIDSDMGATLTYGLENSGDDDDFDINTSTGRLKTKSALDHETKDSYTVTVTVHDGLDAAGDTDTTVDDTITVTITVNDVNEAPAITSGLNAFNVDENTATTVEIQTYGASDVDRPANTLTWSVVGDDGGKFDIDSSSGALTFVSVPNFEMAADNGGDNVYNVTVTVTDNGSPNLDDTLAVTITVNDVNEPPVISSTEMSHTAPSRPEIEFDIADEDLSATAKDVVTYIADDPETDTLTWTVSGTDKDRFNISTNTGVLSFAQRPNYEMPTDAFTSPDTEGDNQYKIVVEVKDGLADSGNSANAIDDSIEVTVTITDVNETPVITGDETPSFAEIEYDDDSTAAELVIGTYSATDDDNSDNLGLQTITWGVNGTDAAHFSINSASGVLSFSIEPDYEDPADLADSENMGAANNEYVVVVEADDGQGGTNSVGTFTVTVSVTDVNERPDIGEDTVTDYMEIEYDFTGTLTEVHTFAATDYDDMDTFEWSLHGEDADHLDIGSTSGVLTFNQPSGICLNDGPLPDYEEPCDGATGGTNTYNVTVRATDDDTSNQKYSDYAVTITVTDVNEKPEITGGTAPASFDEILHGAETANLELATYTARDEEGSTIHWSLDGADEDDFVIHASDGILSFKDRPNWESPTDSNPDNVYVFTVIAADALSDGLEGRVVDVTITIVDLEEAGTVELATLVNDPPLVDDVLTFTLSDPDGGILLTSGDIDWTIEARVPADPPGEWEPIDDADPLMLVKTYTVDEDHTGKEMRYGRV